MNQFIFNKINARKMWRQVLDSYKYLKYFTCFALSTDTGILFLFLSNFVFQEINPMLSISHPSNKKGLVYKNALTIVSTELSLESFVNVFFQFTFSILKILGFSEMLIVILNFLVRRSSE